MKTNDVAQLDLVNIVYTSFFILVNQAILVLMGFLCGLDGKLGWFNIPFAILFFAINIWAVNIWRTQGPLVAFKLYGKINIHCLFILSLLGIAISVLAKA